MVLVGWRYWRGVLSFVVPPRGIGACMATKQGESEEAAQDSGSMGFALRAIVKRRIGTSLQESCVIRYRNCKLS